MTTNKKFVYFLGIVGAILLIVLDQITKKLAVIHLKDQDPVILIDKVFQLRYLENRGAAFGILQGQRVFFLILTIIVLALIAYIYIKAPFDKKTFPFRLVLIFIAAGAVGNCIDRAANAFVVDFLYFNLINFPIFNVADIYVTCSAIVLVILFLFVYKDKDVDNIFKCLKFKKESDSDE